MSINNNISPEKVIKKEEKSPFPRAILSAERKENNSGTILDQGVFSKSKNQQGDKNSSLTYNKTEQQNSRGKGLSFISHNNDFSINNKTQANTYENRVITSNTNIDLGNVSNSLVNNINNNISNFNNQEKSSVQISSECISWPN